MTDTAPPYAVEEREVAAQPTVVARFRVAPADMGARLADVLPAIGRVLAGRGVGAAGQPFSRYHGMKDGMFDLEAGVPTAEPVGDPGDFEASELPAGPVAVTVHVGPYDGLGAAHDAVLRWARQQGRVPRGGSWETYVTDPGAEPDPARWRTDVFLPLEPATD